MYIYSSHIPTQDMRYWIEFYKTAIFFFFSNLRLHQCKYWRNLSDYIYTITVICLVLALKISFKSRINITNFKAPIYIKSRQSYIFRSDTPIHGIYGFHRYRVSVHHPQKMPILLMQALKYLNQYAHQYQYEIDFQEAFVFPYNSLALKG